MDAAAEAGVARRRANYEQARALRAGGRAHGCRPGWIGPKRAGSATWRDSRASCGRNHAAVQAGPTLRWSNGQTEGQIGRLKRLKRQGYGRAKVGLLRQRVIRAA